jgi:hypothetical protein
MNYSRLAPADTFLGKYMAYMSRQETAYVYDFWCAMWLMSCACGRRIFVDRPRAPVYMNLYATLVGESGVVRKSTAVNTASRIARELLADDPIMGFYDAKMSAERLDQVLNDRTTEHQTAQMVIAISELAVFLGTERYMANMPILLTDLYDCPNKRDSAGTFLHGKVDQRDVWVSFLSASTPIWLLKAINPNVVEGGFTSRCLFIVSSKPKKRIAWPDVVATEEDDRAELLSLLKDVRTNAERYENIKMTPHALAQFSRWYRSRTPHADPFRSTFDAREDAHVLRCAAFLAINDGSWVIQSHHLSRSINLIKQVKEDAASIFEGTGGKTKFALGFDAIRNALILSGDEPVLRSRLFIRVRNRMDNIEFDALLGVLHELDAIQRFEYRHNGERGRPAEYIRGTKLLLARGLGEQVMDRFEQAS